MYPVPTQLICSITPILTIGYIIFLRGNLGLVGGLEGLGYDPGRDPQKDLEVTIERAVAEGKRILLEVGGEWCSWCKALDRYVHENQAVTSALERGFLIMKVNFSEENSNANFLSPYPAIPGYPHLFVLDGDGTFLHSQGTGELEQGPAYNQEVFLAFLQRWSPP